MKIRLLTLYVILISVCGISAQIKIVKNPIKVEGKYPLKEEQIDSLVTAVMQKFDVPGISVGIIKDGEIIYEKGHGVRSLDSKNIMNKNTQVGIASNSKAFTCTALALLVDEGKLKWDDKVTQYIPEFKMYDSSLTDKVTIKDLVSHRAGLGLGQGDLMFFPEGGQLTINDIIKRVQFLEPKHSFRNQFDYNNIMFIVAGEVITKVTGKSWAEFIEKRILHPVGMLNSYGSYKRALSSGYKNRAEAHAPIDGKITQVPHDWNETANAAGGIVSTIPDMLKWANFLINDFTTEKGVKLVSDKQIQQLWQIQQPITVYQPNDYNTHFYGYGLGWFLSDVEGSFQVQHTGGLIGIVTQFTLLPDLGLGIIVLTNQQSGAAFNAITNTIKDAYLGLEKRDWIKKYQERKLKFEQIVQEEKQKVWAKSEAFKTNENPLTFEKIGGVYHDKWFGDITITEKEGKMNLVCENSPKLKGILYPYDEKTMIVKWEDRSYDADAFLKFNIGENGKADAIKMEPISRVTDFSFDFGDLNLIKK